jgi:hypothetical protein
MSAKCVIILDVPYGGGILIAKTLEEFGYSLGGDDTKSYNDYQLMAVNQIVCDKVDEPKMALKNAKYAQEPMSLYIKAKVDQGKPWVMIDPMLCVTFCEFIPLLKVHDVDYKIIITMRQPHHSVFDMLKNNKQWNLEKASSLMGRYVVARSMNTERFFVENKEEKEKVMHLSFNDVIDDRENTVNSIANFVGVDLNDEMRNKAVERLKPFPAPQQ